jgi:hypothetical protein
MSPEAILELTIRETTLGSTRDPIVDARGYRSSGNGIPGIEGGAIPPLDPTREINFAPSSLKLST